MTETDNAISDEGVFSADSIKQSIRESLVLTEGYLAPATRRGMQESKPGSTLADWMALGLSLSAALRVLADRASEPWTGVEPQELFGALLDLMTDGARAGGEGPGTERQEQRAATSPL